MRWNVMVSIAFFVIAMIALFFSYDPENVYRALVALVLVMSARYWLSFPASS